MARLFKITGRRGKKSRCWYGKVKVGAQWLRVKLFSDKTASERRLRDLQNDADRGEAGVTLMAAKRLSLPIAELVNQYIESLRVQKKDPEHVRITEWMLNRLVELGEWRSYFDITRENLEAILAKLDAAGATVSYQNKFIVRAKAFVHAVLPEGRTNPLKKLKRVREKGAKRTRERRAADDQALRALFALKLPDQRRLAYALAAYNGLRRNELAKLTWADVHLDATIPFVGLLQKQGTDDSRDYIPLHPYVIKLLRGRPAVPAARVLPAVPDVKTVKRDWERAKVAFSDEAGRRLDFHAFRHTFSTNLDRSGCSRATRKKLKRHAHEDVTDGYGHAELAEMLAALKRLPAPDAPQTQAIVKTGTDDASVKPSSADQMLDQSLCAAVQIGANESEEGGAMGAAQRRASARDFDRKSRVKCEPVQADAGRCLIGAECGDMVGAAGPSTQVD